MRTLTLFLAILMLAGAARAQRFRTLSGHTSDVNAVAFSPDGSYLLSAGADRTARVWQMGAEEQLNAIPKQEYPLVAVAISPDGKWAATGDATGMIVVWQTTGFSETRRFQAGRGAVEALAFVPGTTQIAAVGADGIARLFDLSGQWNQEFRGHIGALYGLAFSADGKWMATTGQDKTIRIWEVQSGRTLHTLSGHTNSIRAVAFSPDGQMLASASLDKTVRIWGTVNGSLINTLPAHPDVVRAVAFSPDGRAIVTACRDGRARVFSPRNGQLMATLEGHTAGLWDVEFCPNGQLMATASADGTARVWDVSFLDLAGAEVATLTLSDDRFAPTVNIAQNIPNIGRRFENRFALVIGNEFYSQYQRGLTEETNVAYARSDANLFAQYAQMALGVPDRNLLLLLDGSSGQMMAELRKLVLLAKNYGPGAEIFLYYAGHGMPHPETQENLLLPVDINANQPDLAISLRSVLELLNSAPSARATVFLDACFSGLARGESPLAQRGVIIRPKAVQAAGNTVVFSAAGSDQAALPYRQARNGLFTYFLLKTIFSYENLTYGFLADRLENEVALNALLIHNRKQNPVVTAAPELGDTWRNWRLAEPATPPRP